MPDLSSVLGTKGNVDSLEAAPRRAGKNSARSFWALVCLCPGRQVRQGCWACPEARRRAPPRAQPDQRVRTAGRGLRRGSRPPGPTQRPSSWPRGSGPARPGPGLTPPLRRLQPRPRSPTTAPRPVAATAAIALLTAAAAVARAPAALTALTPPSAAVNPTCGRQAIPTVCDSMCARAAERWHTLQQ